MLASTIVFSPDQNLLASLERVVEPTAIRGTGSPSEAMDRLKETDGVCLAVDARTELDHTETAALLKRVLDREIAAVNLVTFGGPSLPRLITTAVDLLSIDHLECDCAEDLLSPHTLDILADRRRPRPVPDHRRVVAGEVEVETYTPSFFSVIDDVMRVAHRDVTLLLVGETGTGKTTLARFIHHRSRRADKPFQNLACGALPTDLIESELFGHIRGAFTGADRNKIGRFQAAGRGTLLLDEIDVLDPKQQAKLLKVIETGEYEMVGSTESRISEARLIVASNVNLEELMSKSEFRSDLYYRLNVLEFRLPPLRERIPDIVPVAMSFVDEFCREHDIAVDRIRRDFLDALRHYRWPGNLRELKNHLRRAVLFCENDELTLSDLSPSIGQADFNEPRETQRAERGWTLADRIASSEREMLEQALKANGNNRTRTARALGISRVGLYKKLRRLGMVDTPQKVDVG